MASRDHEILLSLLNDADSHSASLAMAALLAEGDERLLDEDLRKLQETPDRDLRKRVHQLQSTIALRRRRENFGKYLREEQQEGPLPYSGLLEGLIQLHLLWFDNDSADTIRKQYKLLSQSYAREKEKFPSSSPPLEKVAAFLRKKKFRCVHKNELEGENFCLGSLLDEHSGADFLLASLAVILSCDRLKTPIEEELIYVTQSAESDFILVDGKGNIAIPANDWEYVPYHQTYRFELWSRKALLRYGAMLLFTCAASTDSFRYIHTLGVPLTDAAPSSGHSELLPYPYGPKKKNKEK